MVAIKERSATGLRRAEPYLAYKDSEVEWLGRIPEHWEVTPLKGLLVRNDSGVWGEDFDEDGTVVLRSTEQTVDGHWNVQDPARRRLSKRETVAAKLKIGDLVVTKSSGSQAHIGKTSVVDARVASLDCCFSNFMQRLRLDSTNDPRFIWYLLNSPCGREQLIYRSSTTTGLGNLNGGILGAVLVPRVPIEEQRAIRIFLDRETAKISALIAKKERLIELLREKRSALITRVITKGLDFNVLLKDSGVEWLGKIPAHWEVRPLKHVAHFINGFAFKPDEWSLEGTPIIRIENLNGGENFNYTGLQLPEKYCAEKGELLFGWSGNRGTSFGPFLWWREGKHYVNQHIFRLVDFHVDRSWLYWALKGVTVYVEKQAHGIIGMVHVTRGELGAVPIPVLSASEQLEITRYLEIEQDRIDGLVKKVHEAINHLHELRTALISAAVTGQIDVRNEAGDDVS